MRRTALAIVALLALFALVPTAEAKEYQLPDANPAISVTLPDSWKPQDIDTGVEANSPDGNSYIAIETAPKKGIDALITDDIAFLTKSGVTLDVASQKSQDLTLNGIPSSILHWDGKDKDGPTSVTLVIVGATDNLLLLLTSWATPDGDKANGGDMDKILKSLKRM